jgi:hypothetical protein
MPSRALEAFDDFGMSFGWHISLSFPASEDSPYPGGGIGENA